MEQEVAHTGNNKALMGAAPLEDPTRLVERRGDLPAMAGSGRTLTAPAHQKVMRAVPEERVKTSFMCYRQLLNASSTAPVTHLD